MVQDTMSQVQLTCKRSARILVRTVGVAAETTGTVGVIVVGAPAKGSSRITVAILLTPWMLELAAVWDMLVTCFGQVMRIISYLRIGSSPEYRICRLSCRCRSQEQVKTAGRVAPQKD